MRVSRLTARIALGSAASLFVLTTAPAAHGPGRASQGQVQSPTFRVTTALVEVDVVVQDRNGAFVPALTANDLELFEDGKPQQIQQFYMVSQAQRQVLPGAGGSAVLPEDRARRIFVLLFDEGHLAHESLLRAKTGAERFIRAQIGPNDFGGIFTNGGMYNGRLTSSRAELLAGLDTVKVGFENRQSLLAPFREFPRIPGEIDAVRIAEGSLEVAKTIRSPASSMAAWNRWRT
jgi:VWFA-related protein